MSMPKEKYIGIISGISFDGVDVVLCEIDFEDCTLIHFSMMLSKHKKKV